VNRSLLLGVNIDHVATLRQARYRDMPEAAHAEPSVLEAAACVLAAGADSITVHLRADRRHIQDRDVWALRPVEGLIMNLEMGNTPEIVAIALQVKPAFVCLVPEHRQEVTTEGGLDVAGQTDTLRPTVEALQAGGTRVSLFIDPVLEQVRAAAAIGASMVELHTGLFANTTGAERAAEVARLQAAAVLAHSLGLQVNAGHGLTTPNLPDLFAVPHLVELNIGHHLVSRALTVGLAAAVREMRAVMDAYPH
jgi:pyridoxine 5-phosphate synthase